MPKITLPNGMIIEGTEAQVNSTLRILGIDPSSMPSSYYNSETHGLILIADMNTGHLRNALLKIYKEWLDSLYRIRDPQDLVEVIVNGPDDPTFKAMLKEMNTRDE